MCQFRVFRIECCGANCPTLARIELLKFGPYLINQGVVILVSLLHSHQVDWFWHDWSEIDINLMSRHQRCQTGLISVKFKSELRKLEILRKLSCQKLECRKAASCKIQGMSKVTKMHIVWGYLFLLKTSKMCTNYNVDSIYLYFVKGIYNTCILYMNRMKPLLCTPTVVASSLSNSK